MLAPPQGKLATDEAVVGRGSVLRGSASTIQATDRADPRGTGRGGRAQCPHISDLERGVSAAPRRETLAALSEALGLAADDRASLEAAARRVAGTTNQNAWPSQNLPVELTSFVGRDREVRAVRTLLTGVRLVTLTGSGGCGKTRLALRVAAAVLDGYPDGAWFIDLAPVTDQVLVPLAVLAALSLRNAPDRPPLEQLIAYLRATEALLVL